MKPKTLQVSFSKSAAAFIKKANEPLKTRIKKKIVALAKGEEKGLPLRHQLRNYRRVRVGAYRILFHTVDTSHIHIDVIAPRGAVY
jgi:mRNA-degrading endonuclease RelE of RelBE toxin-antitoxin system